LARVEVTRWGSSPSRSFNPRTTKEPAARTAGTARPGRKLRCRGSSISLASSPTRSACIQGRRSSRVTVVEGEASVGPTRTLSRCAYKDGVLAGPPVETPTRGSPGVRRIGAGGVRFSGPKLSCEDCPPGLCEKRGTWSTFGRLRRFVHGRSGSAWVRAANVRHLPEVRPGCDRLRSAFASA
jgi:hypothetical protein